MFIVYCLLFIVYCLMCQGKVKRREYLMYLAEIRQEEKSRHAAGCRIEPKTVEEIRAEFEAKHGSIYEDF